MGAPPRAGSHRRKVRRGSRLTEQERLVLRAYRDPQLHAEAFLDAAAPEFLAGLDG